MCCEYAVSTLSLSTNHILKMHRSRVLSRWAKIVGITETISVSDRMKEILREYDELSKADMRRWVLRKCDRSDYKMWMPHKIVHTANSVRVYYVKLIGTSSDVNTLHTESPNMESPNMDSLHTLVLVISAATATIDEWLDGKLISTKPAQSGTKPNATAKELMEISEYVKKYTYDTSADVKI